MQERWAYRKLPAGTLQVLLAVPVGSSGRIDDCDRFELCRSPTVFMVNLAPGAPHPGCAVAPSLTIEIYFIGEVNAAGAKSFHRHDRHWRGAPKTHAVITDNFFVTVWLYLLNNH
jgi:hypothetical protein